jgi:hypothetical protein
MNCRRNNSRVISNSAGGIANLYYPSPNRGAGLTLQRGFVVTAERGVGDMLNEFMPDIEELLSHRKRDPTASNIQPHCYQGTTARDNNSKTLLHRVIGRGYLFWTFDEAIVFLICHCLLPTPGVGARPITCCMSRDTAAACRFADMLNSLTPPLLANVCSIQSAKCVERKPVRRACAAD